MSAARRQEEQRTRIDCEVGKLKQVSPHIVPSVTLQQTLHDPVNTEYNAAKPSVTIGCHYALFRSSVMTSYPIVIFGHSSEI